MDTVRTRIAPSPTGFPHIGTIYQVLFDYALAKHHNGQFVLRIEDTDRARFIAEAEEVIYKSISWFGLEPDESPKLGGPYGPYRQSERLEIYRKYVDELLQKGHAYYCFCTKERLEEMRKGQEARKEPTKYDGRCRHLTPAEVQMNKDAGMSHVVRMKVPSGETIAFQDVFAGEVSFQSDLIDDQVLLKADGYPTYHMAVVVDDELMKITHILRGKEWISSTPKHILLYRFFGWNVPVYAHLPLILNGDGKGKLSKRHGHASVDYYREQGYLPEAILNYMSLIVWKHPEGKEIYTLEEFIRLFKLEDITSQGPRFDLAKLQWVNGEYIRAMDNAGLVERIQEYSRYAQEQIQQVLPLVKDRLVVLSEFDELVKFFFEDLEPVEAWRAHLKIKNHDESEFKSVLAGAIARLEAIEMWTAERVETSMRAYLDECGWKPGELFMLLRVAVTSRTATPPLFETMTILGKEVTIQRLQNVRNVV